MEGSGVAYLLSEAKIIAGGSINKFLRRKSYNRCRRGNLLLATAMHGLHLERFIEDMDIPSTNLRQEPESWTIAEKYLRGAQQSSGYGDKIRFILGRNIEWKNGLNCAILDDLC